MSDHLNATLKSRRRALARKNGSRRTGSTVNGKQKQPPSVQSASAPVPLPDRSQQIVPVIKPTVAPRQPRPVPAQYVTRVTIVYNATIININVINNVSVGTGQQQAPRTTQPPVTPPRPQPVSQQPSYPAVLPPPPSPAPVPAPLPVAQPTEEEIPIWVWCAGFIVLFFVIGIIFGCVAAS
jgi:hypothetical protein